ncbi:MAG: hypothetical protein ACYDGO_01780 [Smithellaceae bacterium]
MKRFFLRIILLALVFVFPISAMARVDIRVSIPMPPLIVFSAPPELIVIPDTYVYVAPDVDDDLFFWNGWWWRLWDGRWYRSHYYNRGWAYYRNVPSFYFDVDPGWRGYYRSRNWYGHRWDYERIPERRLQQNWKNWNSSRHWERQGTWGVQNYQSRPQQKRQELRQQRQQQYQKRPEVQPQRQQKVQRVEQQKVQRVQQQKVQQVEQQKVQRVQQQGQQKPQGKHEKGEGKRGK